MDRTTESFDNIMLWAASLTTFFSFCWADETTVPSDDSYNPESHLSYSDIAVNDAKTPSIVSLQIKQSKTDQERVGTRVVIGRTGDDICPINAFLTYLSRRRDKPGPLFQWRDGPPLAKSQFVSKVRSVPLAANLPATDFAGHSFRIGAATTAATAGLDDSTIQTLGRWKSSSYLLYVRLEPHHFGISGSKISKVLDLIDVGCLTLHVNKQNVYPTMSHLRTCITNVYRWL